MAERETLGELALRKRALILESELNRMNLRAECENVRAALADLKGGSHPGRWWLLGTAAGFFAPHLFPISNPLLTRSASLLKWLPSLWAIGKRFLGSRKPPGAPAP